nr:MAG TPA: hypothetical protein [Bacteriophage sp.]
MEVLKPVSIHLVRLQIFTLNLILRKATNNYLNLLNS